MRQNGKELFFELCSFKTENKRSLSRLLLSDYDRDFILGKLYMNRMAGVAYGVLEKNELLKEAGRELRFALNTAYQYNVIRNESYYKCIDMLAERLSGCGKKYAMLKGAYLCGKYPSGYRISNDVDLLVMGKDVTLIGKQLKKAGFAQGYIRNNEFVPAGRNEIIMSKMMRGETVPYVMEVNLPCMRYLEVDINFSLDYKNSGDETVEKMISCAETAHVGGTSFPTLCREDFIIHLCEHLYKEATTYPWVKDGRDMTLYKYCDIYYMLNGISAGEADRLFLRIKELGCETACYYAIYSTAKLFGINDTATHILLDELAPDNLSFLHLVEDPQRHAVYKYSDENIANRFWCGNRLALLEGT